MSKLTERQIDRYSIIMSKIIMEYFDEINTVEDGLDWDDFDEILENAATIAFVQKDKKYGI